MWNRLIKAALCSVLLGMCSGCGIFCDRYCDRQRDGYYDRDRRDRCDDAAPPPPRRNYANDCN